MEIKDLIREINNCTSYMATFDCKTGRIAVCISGGVILSFDKNVEYLDDIKIDFGCMNCYGTAKQKNLGNFYALLDLINDFANTPVEERFLEQKIALRLGDTNWFLKKAHSEYQPYEAGAMILTLSTSRTGFTQSEIDSIKQHSHLDTTKGFTEEPMGDDE